MQYGDCVQFPPPPLLFTVCFSADRFFVVCCRCKVVQPVVVLCGMLLTLQASLRHQHTAQASLTPLHLPRCRWFLSGLPYISAYMSASLYGDDSELSFDPRHLHFCLRFALRQTVFLLSVADAKWCNLRLYCAVCC